MNKIKLSLLYKSKSARVLVKVFISMALLAYLVYSYDLSDLWQKLTEVNVTFILLSLAMVIFGVFVSTLKWSLLLGPLGLQASFIHLLRVYYIGCFFNLFMPGSVGGDLIRITLFGKQTGRLMRSGISVLVERFFGILSLWFVAMLSFLFIHNSIVEPVIRSILIIISIMTVILLLVVWFFDVSKNVLLFMLKYFRGLNWEKVTVNIEQSIELLRLLMTNRLLLLKTFALSILFQIMAVSVNVTIATGVGLDIEWYLFFIIVPIVTTVIMVPFSFQGIGLREWSYVALFGMFGIAQSEILAVSILVFSLVIINSLIGGLVYIIPFKSD